MKKIFINAKYIFTPKVTVTDILPKKVTIVGTVQYYSSFETIQNILKENGITAEIGITKQPLPGQILGCDVKLKNKPKWAFLYIGDGNFHPTKLSFVYEKPVFILNPYSGEITRLDEKILHEYKKKKTGAMAKFLNADKIGVLFTTKSGQSQNINLTKKLEKKYPEKKFYSLLSNEINMQSLINFTFIQAWINTACPRIEEDFRCVNIDDVLYNKEHHDQNLL
jgi:2-(3-amino-3-carboxypropyl)histidine synthase